MKMILMLIAVLALPVSGAEPTKNAAKATFAGGCFWCVQPPFDNTPGVLETTVGYTGGKTVDPDYEEVGTGRTGHAEAIQVLYDPTRVSYGALLEVFWRSIDPTQSDGQFHDRGSQYRSAVFFHDDAQRLEAEASKKALAASGRFDKPIVTEITAAGPFYAAEDYHQKYYLKEARRYARYHEASGREAFAKRVWGGSSGIQPFDEERFKTDQAAGKTVLLDFHADWCSTCRKQKASLNKILGEGADLVVYQVDYDGAPDLRRRFNVRSQSTLVVFKGSREAARAAGLSNADAIRGLVEKAR